MNIGYGKTKVYLLRSGESKMMNVHSWLVGVDIGR